MNQVMHSQINAIVQPDNCCVLVLNLYALSFSVELKKNKIKGHILKKCFFLMQLFSMQRTIFFLSKNPYAQYFKLYMMLYVRNSRYALIHVHIKNAALVHCATFDIINTKNAADSQCRHAEKSCVNEMIHNPYGFGSTSRFCRFNLDTLLPSHSFSETEKQSLKVCVS